MAFVSKEPRHLAENRQLVEQSPPANQTQNRPPSRNSAPFNSSSARRDGNTKRHPGPGSYQISRGIIQEKVLQHNLSNQITLLEIQQPASMFKSATKRFVQDYDVTPGPGAYQDSSKKVRPMTSGIPRRGSNKILDFLRSQRKPKLGDILGLNVDFADLDVEIERPQPIKQIKQPSTVFKSTVKRQCLPRPKTSLGPGSYNLSQPFISKRAQNGQKASKRSKSLTQKVAVIASTNTTFAEIDLQNIKKEYFMNINVGPGYYYNDKLCSSFKIKDTPSQNQFFGSKVDRFQQTKGEMAKIGPGSYDISSNINLKGHQSCFFLSKEQRFRQKRKDPRGPGLYSNSNTFDDRLKMLRKRGPENAMNGCSERFQYKKTVETPGPGFYQLSIREQKPQHVQSEPTKPRVKKEVQTPPPGTYDVSAFSIQSRVKVLKNDEKMHSPPFMSCVERFKSTKDTQKIEETLQLHTPSPNKKQAPPAENLKITVPFTSSSQRFVTVKSNASPGPAVYSKEGQMHKKSFNVMFCR